MCFWTRFFIQTLAFIIVVVRIRIHRFRIILGLWDPSLFVRIWIFPSTCKKKFKKPLFLQFFDFLSLKSDVNVSSESNNQKTLGKTFVDILSATDKKAGAGSWSGSKSRSGSVHWYGSADPDPYQNVTGTQHCLAGSGSGNIIPDPSSSESEISLK